MKYKTEFNIGRRKISKTDPTYFIADIAANHDGSLSRAKDLIWLAKEAGADCAKFQHFIANKIVSDFGFRKITDDTSHQSKWKKSVYDTYDQYHTRREWTDELVKTCQQADIEFMTTPYDLESIDMFKDIVPAFKIGSGDITFFQGVEKISKAHKPVLLATGASSMLEVERAVDLVLRDNSEICVMQCNTNYTGSDDNLSHINLSVLKSFERKWPELPLGLSDHTSGHTTVLGAIALGARIIEKHFTDNNSRYGPDHGFAMNPETWSRMITASRDLESALGNGVKTVEENEAKTVIVQRRAIRAATQIEPGKTISASDLDFLRPCPPGSLSPFEAQELIGKVAKAFIDKGDTINWEKVI